MTQDTIAREFTFDTADFNESVSWVTQSMSNSESEKIVMNFYEDEIKFSYRDRTIFLESTCASGNVTGDNGSLQLNATALSRFLKVLPKTSSLVTLKEELNADNIITSLTAKSGNVKAKIPCVSGKRIKKPEFFTTATFSSGEFFPSFSRAGASANTSKEGNNAISAVDFSFNLGNEQEGTKDSITIFGTDSFIMNISEVDCTINQDNNFKESVENKNFLVPAHYSSLKAFASSAKVDETVELIIGEGKQNSLGFSFPNGSLCLFTCLNADPIKAAKKIFDTTKKTITNKFTVDVKEFRNNVRSITSLNPDTETVKLTVREDNLVISDEGGENLVQFPIQLTKTNGDTVEDFSLHNLNFSNFIITKMFNALGNKECTVQFSTESNNAVLLTFDPEKTVSNSKSKEDSDIIPEEKQTRIIVALYR